MTNVMPHEIVFGEIYLSPVLVAIVLAYILTSIISSISVRVGLHKYIVAPAIAELSLLIIFTVLIGELFIAMAGPLGHIFTFTG